MHINRTKVAIRGILGSFHERPLQQKVLNWYSGRHCAAIQHSGLRACAAHIEGRTGDTHLWCVWQLVEHKRLSVKTDDILAMQEPMLYTFTMWLCYNTNTSIDPTFYNCHYWGIIRSNDVLSFDVLSLFVLVHQQKVNRPFTALPSFWRTFRDFFDFRSRLTSKSRQEPGKV